MSRFREEFYVIPRRSLVFSLSLAGVAALLILVFAKDVPLGPRIAMAILAPTVLLIYVLLVSYVYGDSRRRGMRPVLWTLVALFVPNAVGSSPTSSFGSPCCIRARRAERRRGASSRSVPPAASRLHVPARRATARWSPSGPIVPTAEASFRRERSSSPPRRRRPRKPSIIPRQASGSVGRIHGEGVIKNRREAKPYRPSHWAGQLLQPADVTMRRLSCITLAGADGRQIQFDQ